MALIYLTIQSAVAVAFFNVTLRDLLPKFNLVFISFSSSLLLLVAVHLLLHLLLSFERLLCNSEESLFYVLIFACRGFNEADIFVLSAPIFCGFGAHASGLLLQVDLISYQHEGKSFWILYHTFLKKALLPVRHILKGPIISDVVNEEAAICSTVKSYAE